MGVQGAGRAVVPRKPTAGDVGSWGHFARFPVAPGDPLGDERRQVGTSRQRLRGDCAGVENP